MIHGGIKIPKELYYSISIFLLMSIGFIGGHELAKEVQRAWHRDGLAAGAGDAYFWVASLRWPRTSCCAIWAGCRSPTRPGSPLTMDRLQP